MSGDDWSDLQAAWQARPAEPDAVARLEADVQAARRRMQVEAALEAIVSLGSVVVLLWWADGAAEPARSVLLVLAMLGVAMPVVTIWLRRRLWRARGESVAGYRRFLAGQARLGLWFARAGIIGAPAGVLTGLWLAGGVDFGGLPNSPALAWIAGTALLAAWLWTWREARRYRRQLDKLAAADAA
jgi:hypothetical protein